MVVLSLENNLLNTSVRKVVNDATEFGARYDVTHDEVFKVMKLTPITLTNPKRMEDWGIKL
jgi:hypothetical protein